MVAGFEIGHHTADGDGWLTGTTVVLARDGAVGGVDVRGGGPGTRETDLLDPSTLVERVHAVVLTGGSAYGLAAADGVMQALEELGVGFPVGPEPGQVVPIVPAAVIFDLGRGGQFGHRPTAAFGLGALRAARPSRPASGCVGAGTGAQCGGLKGGFGYAEQTLPDGSEVAAAVVVNAVGSAVDPASGRLWADAGRRLPQPDEAARAALAVAAQTAAPSLATTIGVLVTDRTLTKAQGRKVASVGHDGLARAIRPVHSMTDGDTIFCLASGRVAEPDDPWAAFAAFDALLSATGRGRWPAYADLVPAARPDRGNAGRPTG